MYNDSHTQGKKCSIRNEVSCIKVYIKSLKFKNPKIRVRYPTILCEIIYEKMRIDELQNPEPVSLMTQFCAKSFAKIVRIDEF
jgi:hypothetical protein